MNPRMPLPTTENLDDYVSLLQNCDKKHKKHKNTFNEGISIFLNSENMEKISFIT
jgi:hypothetical protein